MVLITGATGLVGGLLLETLIDDGTPFVAIYRSEYRKDQLLSALKKKHPKKSAAWEDIRWVKACLTDLGALAPAFEKVQWVYHCAAAVEMTEEKAPELIKTNAEGTANIVNLCLKYGVKKLAFVSSVAALGNESQDGVLREETPWNNDTPRTAYSYSKRQALLEVWRGAQEGLDVVIVHPGVILGNSHRTGPLQKAIAYASRKKYYYTDGSTGFVSVDDVVTVLHSLMKSPLKNQDFVLVAENSSYKNFLEKLIQTHQLPGRGKHLSKGVLKGLWLVDSVLALLRIKPKTLSKGLVQTLSETSTYDGQKILAALPKFGYQPLEATLIEVIKKD